MKRKVVLSVFVLALVSSSFGVLVGDFEGGSLDGWVAEAGCTVSPSTLGVTHGSGSMELAFPNGGWGTKAYMDAMPYIAELTADGAKVVMDVSARSNDIPGYWGAIDILIDCDGYWSGQAEQSIAIGWTEYFTTQTYEFTLTDAAKTALASATYANLKVFTNSGAGILYIDNIQIVPEPATLSLLGLGVLALIRRKR